MIATSWSANPRKGADVLAWLDRNLDFDEFEVTFAGNTEQTFERIRVVGPLASAPLADLLRSPGRLSRSESRRSLLERAARRAGVRAAGGVSAQRRPSGARRRGGHRLRRRGGAARDARAAARGAGRSSGRDRRSASSTRSPTVTSRRCRHDVGSLAALRRRRPARLVDRRRPRTPGRDRAAARLRGRLERLVAFQRADRPSSSTTTSMRYSRAGSIRRTASGSATSTAAPARRGIPSSTARTTRSSAMRRASIACR